MKRFSFSDLDQWPDFHRYRNGPPPSAPNDIASWVHAIHIAGPYDTAISAGFDRVMRHHTGGNECWLGISGPAHLGKTRAVTSVLMERALAEPDRWRRRSLRGGVWTPYVYVEAASNQGARGLLGSIAHACGLPSDGSEKELHRMLSEAMIELDVQLIVVDDAQMFRRRTDDASKITDGLRTVLHLPAPFVFVGVDLHASALLYRSTRNNDTALQLERRHIPLPLTPLGNKQRRAAARMVGHFKRRVSEVDGLKVSKAINDANTLSRATAACEGRPGSLLNALKRAVIQALHVNDGVLTGDILIHEADRSTQYIESHAM